MRSRVSLLSSFETCFLILDLCLSLVVSCLNYKLYFCTNDWSTDGSPYDEAEKLSKDDEKQKKGQFYSGCRPKNLSCIDLKSQPSKSNTKQICPSAFKSMVNKIANNFLEDPRDRKFYADNYRCWPPPIFIIFVTLIELAFFTYYSMVDGDGSIPQDDLFIYRPDKRQEIWRFAFYMVLHAGWVHLFFNLVIQLLIGLPLEMVHGSVRIGVVYMAGVLAGSLGTSVFDPNVYLLGASGGVYALLSAHLANVVLNYNQMEFGLLRIFGLFVIASTDVGYAVYERYVVKEAFGQTSYVAHFAGAAAGLTLGLVVLKNFEQKLHEQFIWWLSLTIYMTCTISAIIFNICI